MALAFRPPLIRARDRIARFLQEDGSRASDATPDLSAINAKLLRDGYDDLWQMLLDIDAVWARALEANGPSSEVAARARALRDEFAG